MQTKIMFPLIALFFSIGASGQQEYPSTTVNDNSSVTPQKTSFSLAVIPDKFTPAFELHVYNQDQKVIRLQIIHQGDGEVISTSFTDARYARRYNFEEADDGYYLIKVSCGKESVTKRVKLSTITLRDVKIDN